VRLGLKLLFGIIIIFSNLLVILQSEKTNVYALGYESFSIPNSQQTAPNYQQQCFDEGGSRLESGGYVFLCIIYIYDPNLTDIERGDLNTRLINEEPWDCYQNKVILCHVHQYTKDQCLPGNVMGSPEYIQCHENLNNPSPPPVCPDPSTINNVVLNPVHLSVNAKKFWSVSYGQLPLQFKSIQTDSDGSCSFQSNTGSLPVYVQVPGLFGTNPVQIGTSTTSATLTFKNTNDNSVSNIPTCSLLAGKNNNCFITSRPDSSTIDNDAVVRWDIPGFDINIGGQNSGIHINTDPKSYWLDLKDLGFDTSKQLSAGDMDIIENFIHVALINQLSGLTNLAFIQDPPSNNVLVTANDGKKTGKDSDGTVFEEIPGSLYVNTWKVSGVVIPNLVIGEKYNTKVTGTSVGPFTLSSSIVDLEKSTTENTEFVDSFVDDNIHKIGQIKTFDITFSKNEKDEFDIPEVIKTNSAPICTNTQPSQSVLWPPNHKMNPITINNVVDPDNDPITIQITSVFQDEPVSVSDKVTNKGDNSSDKAPDASGIGTDIAQIRSERLGQGDGRVYHIFFTADDGTATENGQCTGEVIVSVPYSYSKNAVDSGAIYDSTSIIEKTSYNSKKYTNFEKQLPYNKIYVDKTTKDPFKIATNH